jgi:hypothetical protein
LVDEVEISNVGGPKGVASEATLAALVKALNTGSNDASRAIRLESLSRQSAAKKLTGESTLLGKAFRTVADPIGGFVSQLVGGSGRLSDFTDAILGTNNILTKSFSVFAHFVDDNVDSLRELSSVGANFNNSIFDMRNAAASSAMNMDEFADLVKNNSTTFAQLGGSVSAGARAFGDFSKGIRTSRVGRELMGMGFSISSINEGLTTYLDMQLQSGRSINLRDRNLIKSSEEYLFQLDGLARLTGKQRDQLAAEMAQLQQDAGIRAQLNNLDEEGRKNLNGTLTFLRSTMPGLSKGFEDIMDGVAQTDLGKAIMSQIPGLGSLMERAFSGELSEADFLKEFQKFGPQISALQGQFSKEQLDAMRAQGGIAATIAELMDGLSEANTVLGMNADEIAKEAAKRSKLSELFGSFSQTLTSARTAIEDAFLDSPAFAALSSFGDKLLGMISVEGGLSKFDSVIKSTTEVLFGEQGILTRVIKSVERAVMGFVGDMEDGKTFSESVSNMMSRLGEDIAYGWNEFWTGPIGTKIYDTVTYWWERLFFKLREGLNEVFGIQMFVDNAELEKDRIRLGLANEQETEKFLAEQRALIKDLQAEVSTKTTYQEQYDPTTGDGIDYTTDIALAEAEIKAAKALIAEVEALKLAQDQKEARAEKIAKENTPANPSATGYNIPQTVVVSPEATASKALGTLKATGYNFEPQDAVTQIHAGERVLNSQETQTFNNLNSIQSDLVKKVEELNTSMLKAVDLLKDSVDAAKATSRSIKSLGTDAMRGVGR